MAENRRSHVLPALAVALLLQPLPAMAVFNDVPNSPGVAVIRITAQPEQFCQSEGHLSYMPEGTLEKKHSHLAEWAKKRRFIIDRHDDGVMVKIVPPPSIRDTRSAVAELSFFFALVSRQCPPHMQALPVLSTGVEGLTLITDERGEPDFEFTP